MYFQHINPQKSDRISGTVGHGSNHAVREKTAARRILLADLW